MKSLRLDSQYETLEKQIRALPEAYLAEISEFIAYLTLKKKFASFEDKSDKYFEAIKKWRLESADLFENEEDRDFMEHAFENLRTKETVPVKDVW